MSDELTDLMNEAVTIAKRYRRRNLYPELILMLLVQQTDTAAYRLLQVIAEERGTDLERLIRQSRLAMEAREDVNGDLDLLLLNGQKFALSRQMLIAFDEGLTIAQSRAENKINTDHLLSALTHTRLSTSVILQQNGITQAVMYDLFSADSHTVMTNSTSSKDMAGRRGCRL